MTIASAIAGIKEILAFDNGLQLLLQRTFFRRHGVYICVYRGMYILVDHSRGDVCGIRPCLLTPMYQSYISQMQLGESVTVIDAGANVGGFSLLLRALGVPVSKLICVELDASTAARLQFNLSRNFGSADWKLYNAALCGSSGVTQFSRSDGSTSTSITNCSVGTSSSGTARAITFDELWSENFRDDQVVDICKIDIEGAEYELLGSSTHTKLSQCRYLLIEIHQNSEKNRSGAIAAIKAHGFEQMPRSAGVEEDVYGFVNAALR